MSREMEDRSANITLSDEQIRKALKVILVNHPIPITYEGRQIGRLVYDENIKRKIIFTDKEIEEEFKKGKKKLDKKFNFSC